MGYSTEFAGKLLFVEELKASEIARLNIFLGKDIKDIDSKIEENWYDEDDDGDWYHIDLCLTPELDGLKWDGSEKTYGMVNIVNFITRMMREKFPNFEMKGELEAQGEEFDDRWKLVMENGFSKKVDVNIVGDVVTCPHCDEQFVLEE